MALEIEAKLKVVSHQMVRRQLRAMGATCVGTVLETNIIFDDAARSLLAGDRGLRVRRIDPIDGEAPPATLTYKGAKDPSALKQRQEIEVAVDDPDTACELLRALGFVEVLCFQKRRETWVWQQCRVELDLLPYLGRFIEIEAPETADVLTTQNELGLAGEPVIADSYIALLADYCRDRRLPFDRILLTDPKDDGE